MPTTSYLRGRTRYIALALGTIAVGLLVHRGVFLGRTARDVLGDALWAAMMVWWISALKPDAPLLLRSAAALAVCFAVELGQLIHTPGLDALRNTAFGSLVLGSGFDPRDFVSYAVGVLAAAAIDRFASERADPSLRSG